MSRSPNEGDPSVATTASEAYLAGWAATMDLVRSGRSFSGRERNCAFLGGPGGRFADVSAAAGLDHPDDGRALAVCD